MFIDFTFKWKHPVDDNLLHFILKVLLKLRLDNSFKIAIAVVCLQFFHFHDSFSSLEYFPHSCTPQNSAAAKNSFYFNNRTDYKCREPLKNRLKDSIRHVSYQAGWRNGNPERNS
jgi:hypothetical protein